MARSLATYGIYPSMSALHTGAEALKAEGFRQTDISVLYSDRRGPCGFAGAEQARGTTGMVNGASASASILGYLAGIGALTLPGIGPLLAAGPLVNAFTGAAATRASEGLTRTLVGLGLAEPDAQRYEGCLKQGGILLSVNCDDADWAGRARRILSRTGAEHLSAAAEMEAAYPS